MFKSSLNITPRARDSALISTLVHSIHEYRAFIHSFSFSRYLSSTCYVPGSRYRAVNQTDKIPALMEVSDKSDGQTENKIKE